MAVIKTEVVVIGAGMAGLAAADCEIRYDCSPGALPEPRGVYISPLPATSKTETAGSTPTASRA